MISTAIVISYDNDNQLGSYFSECAQYAVNFLEAYINISCMNNSQCNSVYFDMKVLPMLSEKNSILVIYSHGNENAFLYQNKPFIESTINTDNIQNTVVYTNSCSTGKVFGKTFDKLGGVFIGYESDLLVPTDPFYRKVFIRCDNSGLFHLFKEKIKLADLSKAVKNNFNHNIDNLYESNYVIASYLQEARDNFVVLGQNLNRTII
ncbi:MAG: hypothetical protein WAX77_09385 [Methylococcaceae bacterium]